MTFDSARQGDGDVSQLQDALAYALCGVEGVREVIPEEILAEEGVATDVEELRSSFIIFYIIYYIIY